MTVLWVMQMMIMIFLLADVLLRCVVDNIVDVCCSCHSLVMLLILRADVFTIAITANGVVFFYCYCMS
jgi:hypothetical protein